ncbi:transcriptional regulator swi6 [Blyttiomyces sp. JEL0837]|nr:transcriptional regulator swi6 [Blyttiomyces sp. JEL0837]
MPPYNDCMQRAKYLLLPTAPSTPAFNYQEQANLPTHASQTMTVSAPSVSAGVEATNATTTTNAIPMQFWAPYNPPVPTMHVISQGPTLQPQNHEQLSFGPAQSVSYPSAMPFYQQHNIKSAARPSSMPTAQLRAIPVTYIVPNGGSAIMGPGRVNVIPPSWTIPGQTHLQYQQLQPSPASAAALHKRRETSPNLFKRSTTSPPHPYALTGTPASLKAGMLKTRVLGQEASGGMAMAPKEVKTSNIFVSLYGQVLVQEMLVGDVAVMRRCVDGFMNATQILKVAGLNKTQRTSVIQRELLSGVHIKVQGGYGKYQGTWIPVERARDLARSYGVYELLAPMMDLPSKMPANVTSQSSIHPSNPISSFPFSVSDIVPGTVGANMENLDKSEPETTLPPKSSPRFDTLVNVAAALEKEPLN